MKINILYCLLSSYVYFGLMMNNCIVSYKCNPLCYDLISTRHTAGSNFMRKQILLPFFGMALFVKLLVQVNWPVNALYIYLSIDVRDSIEAAVRTQRLEIHLLYVLAVNIIVCVYIFPARFKPISIFTEYSSLTKKIQRCVVCMQCDLYITCIQCNLLYPKIER